MEPVSKEPVSENKFVCSLHNSPRTLVYCEDNCRKYYNCDTVAIAIDLETKQERGD